MNDRSRATVKESLTVQQKGGRRVRRKIVNWIKLNHLWTGGWRCRFRHEQICTQPTMPIDVHAPGADALMLTLLLGTVSDAMWRGDRAEPLAPKRRCNAG